MENHRKSGVRRLYRSQEDRVVAGVCGGLAEYFNLDPVIIRIALLVLSLLRGSGLLLYIIAWILIPRHP